jgi:crossover junction endodeoxyribonuclease RuvC
MTRPGKRQGSVVCIDLGTKTGFAILRPDGKIESGQVNLQLKAGEGAGMRYVRFRRWLVEVKQAHDPIDEIVYEMVMGHGAFQVIAAHCFGGLLATLQAFGEHHQLAYRGIGVSTIKKQFAGHGKASKTDVIHQCEALGFRPASDNEADAIALLHVATGRCPVLTMTGATPKKGARKTRPMPELRPGETPF